MDPVVAEVVKWVPQTLLGFGFISAVVYIGRQFIHRFDALEGKVDRALAEADKRVTVADHRESMNQVWTVVRSVEQLARDLATERRRDREEFAELRADVSAKKRRT